MELLEPPELARRILAVKPGTHGLRPIDIEVMLGFVRKPTRLGTIKIRQKGRTSLRSLSLQTGHETSSMHASLARLGAAGLLVECAPKRSSRNQSKITGRRLQIRLRRLNSFENGRLYSALYRLSGCYAWTYIGHDIAHRKGLGFLGLQVLDIIASQRHCNADSVITLLGASRATVYRTLGKLLSLGLIRREVHQYFLTEASIEPDDLARTLGTHGQREKLRERIFAERRQFQEAREWRQHLLLMGEPPLRQPEDKHHPGDTYNPDTIVRFSVLQDHSQVNIAFWLAERDSGRRVPASGRARIGLLWGSAENPLHFHDFTWDINSDHYIDCCTDWWFDYRYLRSIRIPEVSAYCSMRRIPERGSSFQSALEENPRLREWWASLRELGVTFEADFEFTCASTGRTLKRQIRPRLLLPPEYHDELNRFAELVEEVAWFQSL